MRTPGPGRGAGWWRQVGPTAGRVAEPYTEEDLLLRHGLVAQVLLHRDQVV